ncbi:hypothetical protein [Chryseobacterium aquifrigidense]|uniref:Uncharacterized protein n=1 Tax=Chryseobacterium aquifrigidense TaxID=558021 RepID=A0A543E9Q8_9FLAO|nr:hypothetical protein [Chryseobacterium aquifrigidense]TQM18317.1 hypothetical protein FB551_4098 [Chryseobacterium aquifrigidense]
MKEIEEPVTVTLGNGATKTFYKYDEEIFTEKTTMLQYIDKNYPTELKVDGKIKEDDRYSIYHLCKDVNSEPIHTVLLVL